MELQNSRILKDGSSLSIIRANPEDAAEMIDFLNRIGGETDNLTFGGGEFHMTVEKETEFLEGLQKSQNSIMILGRINSQIVSIANLSASNKTRMLHAAELGTSVIKAHWHLGVGTAMMEYLITWAKRSGIIRKIDLSVRTTNHRAIQLYEQLGFQKEGIKTRCMFINGEFCDTVEMGLKIE